MKAVRGDSFGTELCHILGLDPMQTGEITIHIKPGHVVFFDIQVYASDDTLHAVNWQRYKLVEADKEDE